jgi:hypothetical protein
LAGKEIYKTLGIKKGLVVGVIVVFIRVEIHPINAISINEETIKQNEFIKSRKNTINHGIE